MRFLVVLFALLALVASIAILPQKAQKAGNGPMCMICIEAMTELAQYADDKDVLEKKVNEFCEKLSILAGICESIVDKDIDTLAAELKEGDYGTICRDMKLCSS